MAGPRSILNRIRSFGSNIVLDHGKLIVVNKEKLPPGALDFIRQNARDIADFIEGEAAYEERAAIMEYDGGLNRPIAEFLARMLMANPPEGADRSDWSWYVGQATQIIDRELVGRAA